ncbi:carbohydrate ABC transporter membrane protein 2 (CUT1 family) [Pseudonocardia hierapolitana]|uniref:Carbohydrate ABC transporter membrane protein 2 (CUT1 family) n=2 Tax=Pseudonocardia hierapolitana TaxID=1128676 RepID=A0A561SRY4_9PSEU|nr:carbohydrate ABC transporter membrane protein 2 (CUT1 family) [Pseudonocardia hierapolitana]
MTAVDTAPAQRARSTRRAAAEGGSRTRRPSVVLTAMLLGLLAYFLLPLAWLAINSTKSSTGLFESFGLWFADDFHLFENVRDVLTYTDGIYVRWFLNTVVYAVVGAGGAALLAALGGYGVAKFDFPGRRLLLAGVLGAVMVPVTALAIPTYLLLSSVQLVDTPFAVIIPSLASPFGLYLMWIYAAAAVPDELLEAARLDGAGELRIFWSVAMRLLAPGFVTVLLFQLVHVWNNYFLPLIVLNDPAWFPLTVGLKQWNEQAYAAGGGGVAVFNLVITGSLLAIIPLIAVFLVLQRYWQAGIAMGAVKQ